MPVRPPRLAAQDSGPRHAYPSGRDSLPPVRYGYGMPGAQPACHIHSHDYAELFWIERGRCRHQANGVRCDLYPGALVFIRPADRHSMEPLDKDGFSLVNLVVSAACERDLRQRYGDQAERWPWWTGQHPRVYPLPPAEARILSRLAADCGTNPTRLERDLIILAAIRMAWSSDAIDAPREVPGWLRQGLAAGPQDATGLAVACGHGIAHVNRTVRQLYGCTTREFLLRRRLESAAMDLAHGDASIAKIAVAADFSNLAWFHRSFRDRYGCTPRAYRLACRRGVNEG